ncbi:MAG: TadE/TadG family type IV pilus assembly protein [Limnohabitans sp.]
MKMHNKTLFKWPMPRSDRFKQRGAALVELTIVLVLLLVPLLLGVIEVGRLIYTYKTLVHQVHHTTRYLSVQAPGQNHESAKCLFKTGKLQATCTATDTLLSGFNAASFELTIDDASTSSAKKGIPTGDATYPTSVNVVTITANQYPYTFTFSDLFNMPSMAFGPVSATFRQVN